MTEAARHWARRAVQPANYPEAEDAERESFNVDKAAWRASFAWDDEDNGPAPQLQPDGAFSVWPCNWDTVMLFWSVQNCWVYKMSARIVGMCVVPFSQVIGMDWALIESKLRMRGLTRKQLQREEARLELMETAILKELRGG